MKIIKLLVLLLVITSGLSAKNYTKKTEVKQLINNLVKYHHFDKNYLNNLFKNVKYQKKALAVYVPSLRKNKKHKPYVRPKNHVRKGTWDIYEKYFVKPSKIKEGVKYLHTHKKDMSRAYRKYHVEPEYITAIIGVESDYGKYKGKYPVFDSLVTLSFEKNRRQNFFKKELKEFLILSKKEKFNPLHVKGSFAGAIGLGQFMPSNYNEYVVDFNNDGKKRMTHHTDAIGSIAHYFYRHGWKKGRDVAVPARYNGNRYMGHKTGFKHKYNRSSLLDSAPKAPFNYKGKVTLIKLKRGYYDELWYGSSNFYAITRYNHQDYYAMAVHQLAQEIKKEYKKQYGLIIR